MEKQAPAKLNLGLKILGRRPDGFHELESIFVPLQLADRLSMEVADRDAFSCSDSSLPMDENNLVVKALRLWREESHRRGRPLCHQAVQLHLHKNIPAGAGLGGGSSDAAACLLLLEEHLGEGDPGFPLAELALKLGSDVPFFLQPGWCHVTGRGEILTPIEPLFQDAVVVLWPGLHVSTGWAYAELSRWLTKQGAYASFHGSHDFVNGHADPSTWPENDFETVVFAAHPQLREAKALLKRMGARFAAMSGSGSALFALFEGLQTARLVAQELQSRYPVVVSTLPLDTPPSGKAEKGEADAHYRGPCQPAS